MPTGIYDAVFDTAKFDGTYFDSFWCDQTIDVSEAPFDLEGLLLAKIHPKFKVMITNPLPSADLTEGMGSTELSEGDGSADLSEGKGDADVAEGKGKVKDA